MGPTASIENATLRQDRARIEGAKCGFCVSSERGQPCSDIVRVDGAECGKRCVFCTCIAARANGSCSYSVSHMRRMWVKSSH